MGSPLDVIKDGIKTGDWSRVCQGYNAMTGDNLTPAAGGGGSWALAIHEIYDKCAALILEPAPKKKVYVKAGKPPKAKGFVDNIMPPEPRLDECVVELPPVEDDHNKFHVQHSRPGQQVREDGKKEAVKLPFEPGLNNEFCDDGTLAVAEADLDTNYLPKAPSARRAPVKFVKVKCTRCGKEEEVNPNAAPRRLATEDDNGSYICNSCVSRAIK